METLYQSLVAVEPLTLIATICNLFVQMFIIKKFFLDKILAVLDQRRQAADKQISEAQTARQEADNIRKEAEISSKQRIAEAMSDARKIVADANSESKRILDEATARTRQLEVEYDSMLSSKMNFLTKFRNFLTTELDMVTASEDLLEKAKPQTKPLIKQKIFTDKELDLAKTTVMPAIILPEEAEAENKADDKKENPQAESEDK